MYRKTKLIKKIIIVFLIQIKKSQQTNKQTKKTTKQQEQQNWVLTLCFKGFDVVIRKAFTQQHFFTLKQQILSVQS